MAANLHKDLDLFSSTLASTEARLEFSRRLAERATAAFSNNSLVDSVRRSMELPGGLDSFAKEAEKLRAVFVQNLPLYEALSNISSLSSSFRKTSELHKAFESLPDYGKLRADILKATDLPSAFRDQEK